MLRSVAILVVIGLASVHAGTDKATCAAVDVDLGMCGKLSGKACVPKGIADAAYMETIKTNVANIAATLTTAGCKEEGAAQCNSGYAVKSNYCSASGAYCTTRKIAMSATMCTTEADCDDFGNPKNVGMKKMCCSAYGSVMPCDFPSSAVEMAVKGAKDAGYCADSNCISSAISLRFSVIIPAVAAAFAMIASAF